jgi:ribosomal protein S10
MQILYVLTFTGYCGTSLEKLCKIFFTKYDCSGIIHLPLKKQKFIVIKSPHVFKKSREQFESFVYKKTIYIKLKLDEENLFIKVLKGISWAYLGVSLKKLKISKNAFYI